MKKKLFISDVLYLTDGGLETDLIFHHKIELPLFASFMALKSETGQSALKHYYQSYLKMAKKYENCGMILDTATWRASPDWFNRLGITLEEGTKLIHESYRLVKEIPNESENQLLIAGVVGPRGDGYSPGNETETFSTYQNYHTYLITELKRAGVDYISAVTMTNVPEALGITLACKSLEIPCVISFTVETDGLLPSGTVLAQALQSIDERSQNYPLHYMINCAHPSHFIHLWNVKEPLKRIRGIRCNASSKSHKELDESTQLDEGNIEDLARLVSKFTSPGMPLDHSSYRIVGGCCGTDIRHIAAMGESLFNNKT